MFLRSTEIGLGVRTVLKTGVCCVVIQLFSLLFLKNKYLDWSFSKIN